MLSPRLVSVKTTSRCAQPARRRTRAHLTRSVAGFPRSLSAHARCFHACGSLMMIHAAAPGCIADQAYQGHCSCAWARRRRLVLLGAEALELWRGVRAGGAALVDRHQLVLPRWADSAARKLRPGTFSCADNPDASYASCGVMCLSFCLCLCHGCTRHLNQAGFRHPASRGPYLTTLAMQIPHS